jgi:hypothetical protein
MIFATLLRLRPAPVACLLCALAFISCEENTLSPVAAGSGAPFVSAATVTPTSSLNIDNLTPVNGKYLITAAIFAKVSDPDGPGDIAQVTYRLYKLNSAEVFTSGTMNRLSGLPDTSYLTFSANVSLSVARSETGTYRIEITAEDNAHLVSNALSGSLRVTRTNTAPVLGVPGIRTLASAFPDSARFLLFVNAADSDGIADINLVQVQTLNTTDTSPRVMPDNGPGGSGDLIAGDGVFSLVVSVKPLTSPADVVFEFSAKDNAGAQSNIVRRTLRNRPPIINSLAVPDSIQLPSDGSKLVLFYMTASDSDGLGDIDSAYFRNESSSTPTSILMYDDGDLNTHGDDTAGDGVFSRILSIDAGTSTGNKEFHFHVVDKEGARAEVIRTIKIYR